MRRPRKIWLFERKAALGSACIIAAAFGVAWIYPSLTEPRFEQVRVSEWIERAPFDNSSDSNSRRALEHFGAAATPYLAGAVKRTAKWGDGLLSRIPLGWFDEHLFNRSNAAQVHAFALGRLGELASAERRKAEFEANPSYPVCRQVARLCADLLSRDKVIEAEESFISMLNIAEFIDQFPELLPLVRAHYRRVLSQPGKEVRATPALAVFAAARDASMIPEILPVMSKNDLFRRQAVVALGKMEETSPTVAQAIWDAMAETNALVAEVAPIACISLGLPWKEEPRHLENRVPEYPLLQALSAWLAAPEKIPARQRAELAVRSQLNKDRSNWWNAINMLAILEALGPKAILFKEDIVPLLDHEYDPVTSAAAKALRRIDPAGANEAIRRRDPAGPSQRSQPAQASRRNS